MLDSLQTKAFKIICMSVCICTSVNGKKFDTTLPVVDCDHDFLLILRLGKISSFHFGGNKGENSMHIYHPPCPPP